MTAAEDETFRLYNCKTGKHVARLSLCLVKVQLINSPQTYQDAPFEEVWR